MFKTFIIRYFSINYSINLANIYVLSAFVFLFPEYIVDLFSRSTLDRHSICKSLAQSTTIPNESGYRLGGNKASLLSFCAFLHFQQNIFVDTIIYCAPTKDIDEIVSPIPTRVIGLSMIIVGTAIISIESFV